VAQNGLLKERDADTIYSWLKGFSQRGISSLTQKERRKPSRLTAKEKAELRTIIQQKTPMDYGISRFRWSLKTLLSLIPSLSGADKGLSSIWYLLRRMGISSKRGRDFSRSPDVAKRLKIRRIRAYLGYARKNPDRVAFLFLDEFSFYRQPKVGPAWWPIGRRCQPPAMRSCRNDTRGRIVGAINAVSGELSCRIASAITVEVLCDFLLQLREKYSDYAKIYLVLDNWYNVHNHPQTLATMQQLGIIPLFWPTYCPESNPIEKLWQGLKRDILTLHRDSESFPVLKQHVREWLSNIKAEEILQMVGLKDGRAIAVNY
jgi:transposase